MRRAPRAIKRARGTDRPDRARRDSRPSSPPPPKGAAVRAEDSSSSCASAEAGSPLPLAPPLFLSASGKKQWEILIPRLAALRGERPIEDVDVPALAMLCEALSLEQDLYRAISKQGVLLKTSGGGLKSNALLRSLQESRQTTLRLLISFGLAGPGSRKGSEPPPPPPPGPGRGRLDQLEREEKAEEENYFASVRRTRRLDS